MKLHPVCLLGVLVFSVSTSLRGADPAPRLFPDVAIRFPVGDPNAENPIADTEGPKNLAAADMNGDGLADVIVGNLDGSISVLLGRRTNSLSAEILTPATGLLTNSSLRAVVVADFNQDGKPDVAAGDIAREGVIILAGRGDGALDAAHRISLGPVRAMAAADFDADGKADLLVACSPPECTYCAGGGSGANQTNRFLCILRGNGDSTFQAPRYLLMPRGDSCFYDVEAADIDGDGDRDALALDFRYCGSTDGTVTRVRQIQIFANRGGGDFATNTPTAVLHGAGEGPRAFHVAYVDERHSGGNPPPGATLDIVLVNRDSASLDVFLNAGGLKFSEPESFHAGSQPRDAAIGDLDGDGLADLAVVNRDQNTVGILRGAGGGRFLAPSMEIPAGVSPRQIVLADINGDRLLDAAVNNRESGDVSLFIGRAGLAGFSIDDAFYPAGISPVSVVTGDFDRDGVPDVATASIRSHDLRVRLNRGDGRLGPETIYGVDEQPAFLAAGDVNRDGKSDLVVACLGRRTAGLDGSLMTLLGRGDGTFADPVRTSLGASFAEPYWLRLGDLSGDGILDAVVGSLRGELVVLRGIGSGTFELGLKIGIIPNGRPLGFALGDFDRDGKVDVATSRGIIVLNDGQFFDGNAFANGVWQGRTKPFNAGTQAWAVEADDLDEDGILDLIVALTFVRPDPIAVYFGLGDGTLTEPTIYEGPDVGAVSLVAADMDGDRVKDIVIGNRCFATVMIYQGVGQRRFKLRETVRAYSVEDVAVADLNGDQRLDIVGAGIGVWPVLNGGSASLGMPKAAGDQLAPDRIGLFLNEIMSQNRKYHVTNSITPDWIEIYNHTTLTQNLAGWSLEQYTADAGTNRWHFPVVGPLLIPPGGYLAVYCKKNPGTNAGIYASFELSSEGENLALVRPDGRHEDFVHFPALASDVSYARYPDGTRYFAYHTAPTFGSANRQPSNLKPIADRKDPYVGPAGSALGINARFFDDVAIAYAAVCFRAPGESTFRELALSDDGLHGDKEAGDGYYGVLLPALAPNSALEYFLRVIDLEGQTGTSPDDVGNPAELHRLTVPGHSPALRLTEILAGNSSGLLDERGQAEDWLEIMNTGPVPVKLERLALSKDYYDTAHAWILPADRSLQPGERLIVFCDDDPGQGPFHATFKLLRSGDRVFLIQTDTWTVLDSLSFGPMPADTSFGVVERGTTAGWLAWPTPRAENIAMPPAATAAARAPALYVRPFALAQNGARNFAFRWLGTINRQYRIDLSDDLRTWRSTPAAGAHLGEGLYQWTEAGGARAQFYRVVQLP